MLFSLVINTNIDPRGWQHEVLEIFQQPLIAASLQLWTFSKSISKSINDRYGRDDNFIPRFIHSACHFGIFHSTLLGDWYLNFKVQISP